MEHDVLMKRILPASVIIAVGLWTLTSLVRFWRLITPQSSTATELEASLLSGDAAALPLLKAAHPDALTVELMQRLAAHPDLKLRELTAHQAWTPRVSLDQQVQIVQSLEPDWVRKRGALWLTRRATSQNTLTLSELETYWSSK